MTRHDLTAGIKFVFSALLIGVCLALIFETCDMKPAFADPDTPNTGQESKPQGAVAYLLENITLPSKTTDGTMHRGLKWPCTAPR